MDTFVGCQRGNVASAIEEECRVVAYESHGRASSSAAANPIKPEPSDEACDLEIRRDPRGLDPHTEDRTWLVAGASQPQVLPVAVPVLLPRSLVPGEVRMNDCRRCSKKEFWFKFSSTIRVLLEQNDLQSIQELFKEFLAVYFETPGTHASLKKGDHCNLHPRAFMPDGEAGALLDKTFRNALRVHRDRKIKTARRSAAAGSSSLFRLSRSRVYDICSSFSGTGCGSGHGLSRCIHGPQILQLCKRWPRDHAHHASAASPADE
jgi:hypothetical protein